MKRCRTPREKEMEERDTLCVISGVYKRAYHQSVSSRCREKMKYHVIGAERRSYGWHLIWCFSAQQHKHNATHTSATWGIFHLPRRAATQPHAGPNMLAEPCAEIYCDLFLLFFSLCRKWMCLRGARGWGIWVGGRIGGDGGYGCQALINRQWFNWHFN